LAAGAGGPLGVGNVGAKFFYAATFRLLGDSLVVIGLANAVVYALAVVLLYVAAERLFDRPTAIVAAALCAVSPSELLFNNLASTEVLGALFMAALLLVLTRPVNGWRWALLVGAVGGLATYNRSNLLPLGALVFAHLLFTTRRVRAALGWAAVVQIVVLLMTSPLAFFYLRHFGRFSPTAPGSAENLWYGNNPLLRGDAHFYAPVPEELPPGGPRRKGMAKEYAAFYVNPDPDMELSQLNRFEAADVKAHYAIGWIRHNRGRYVHLVWARLRMLFSHCTFGGTPYLAYDAANPAQPRWSPSYRRLLVGSVDGAWVSGSPLPPAQRAADHIYRALALLAAIGLVLSIVADPAGFVRRGRALPLLMVAFYVAPFALTLGLNRYKVPVLPLMWIYAAAGIVFVARRLTARHPQPHAQSPSVDTSA
jgi:hypothetical protein